MFVNSAMNKIMINPQCCNVNEQTVAVYDMNEFYTHNLEGKKLNTKGYVLSFM